MAGPGAGRIIGLADRVGLVGWVGRLGWPAGLAGWVGWVGWLGWLADWGRLMGVGWLGWLGLLAGLDDRLVGPGGQWNPRRASGRNL